MRLTKKIPVEDTACDGSQVITIYDRRVYVLYTEYADVSLLEELQIVNRRCETLAYVLLAVDAYPKPELDNPRKYSFPVWILRGLEQKYMAAMPKDWYRHVDAAG